MLWPSRGFIHPPLTFQMDEVKVWFRVNEKGRNPIHVRVSPDDDVLDALETALVKAKLLDIAPDKVTVKFRDGEVLAETLIKDELERGHGNNMANCFLLELPQDDGKKTWIFK